MHTLTRRPKLLSFARASQSYLLAKFSTHSSSSQISIQGKTLKPTLPQEFGAILGRNNLPFVSLIIICRSNVTIVVCVHYTLMVNWAILKTYWPTWPFWTRHIQTWKKKRKCFWWVIVVVNTEEWNTVVHKIPMTELHNLTIHLIDVNPCKLLHGFTSCRYCTLMWY